MSWKDLQLIFTKDKNMKDKRVKWADKLEEIHYFIKEKDLNVDPNCEKCAQNTEVESKNNRNKIMNNSSKKATRIIDQVPQESSDENLPKLTKEMVRLALCRNDGSNAEKNWKRLFKLVSSAVLDDRINDVMKSEWV